MIEHFHAEHNRAYGYFNKKMRIQMVNYRVAAVGAIMKPSFSASAIDRATPLPEAIDYRKVLFDGLDDERRTPVYLRDDIKPGCSIDGPHY
jgi:N-methylhydantoinase A